MSVNKPNLPQSGLDEFGRTTTYRNISRKSDSPSKELVQKGAASSSADSSDIESNLSDDSDLEIVS